MASGTIAYGRALYYPHINFQNEAWAKSAALYYKGLNRIVPEGYGATKDVEIIQRLNDEEEFTRNINPGYAAENIARDFIKFARTELTSKEYREQLLAKIGRASNKEPFSIHTMKMAYMLRQDLPRLGLAKRDTGPGMGDWYEFEPATGAMYMTFLANYLAEQDQLPVVTDNPVFQPLITGSQLERLPASRDLGQTLASLVIKAAVPEDIASIPAKKIIEFRKRYDDERHLFYNEINKLVKDLVNIEDETVLKDCLKHKKKDIEIATKDLKKAFNGMKISTTTALLGISIPSFFSGIGALVAGTGVLMVATGKTLEQGNKYYRSKESSPYGYVLSLRKNLKSETFAQQLIRGKLIL